MCSKLPTTHRLPSQEPALDLGCVQPGEVRCCRVVLRNRGPGNLLLLGLDTSSAPWLTATFRATPLAPGVPRVIDVSLAFPAAGEYSGELRVLMHSPTSEAGGSGSQGAKSIKRAPSRADLPSFSSHVQLETSMLSSWSSLKGHPESSHLPQYSVASTVAQLDDTQAAMTAPSGAASSATVGPQHGNNAQVIVVPIYALVGMARAESTVPRSRAARSAFAVKAAASLAKHKPRPQSRQSARFASINGIGHVTQSLQQAAVLATA
jgi:hypothetical protein